MIKASARRLLNKINLTIFIPALAVKAMGFTYSTLPTFAQSQSPIVVDTTKPISGGRVWYTCKSELTGIEYQ